MKSLRLRFTPSRQGLSLQTVTLLLSSSCFAIVLTVASAQSVQTLQNIDLGVTPNAANVQILGAAAGDHLSGSDGTFSTFPRARAIASGDFNDDGFDDIVVGASDVDFTPTGGSARADAGAVYIVFGRGNFASPTVVDANLAALSQPDVKVFGAAAGDNVGFAVAAGDLNNDGIDDLAIGAPGFDRVLVGPPAVDRQNTGGVYILFGNATTFIARTIDLSTANPANILIVGEGAGDRFGSAISIADVNGGTSPADLLVGAPASKGPDPLGAARDNGGAAYLFFGGTPLSNPGATISVIDSAVTTAPVRVFGKTGSRLGSSLAIGDVNSGGAADLVVGAPTANRPDPGGDVLETGSVFIVLGGSNLAPIAPATTKIFDVNAGQQNSSVHGASANDHLGASVAAGDVNNDGTRDLTVGAPDADGPSDLRLSSGEAYVILGAASLVPANITVGPTSVALTVFGAAAGDHLGATVVTGVVNTTGNTDTITDVILGAPGAQSSKGNVSILFGGPTLIFLSSRDLALGQDDIRVIGQVTGDELGWAIAIGDFDDNSGGDLAMGAPFNDVSVATPRMDAGKAYVILAAADVIPPVNENPVVTVGQPNGGETIQGGATFQIQWAASDGNGDETIQNQEIRLSTDGGSTFNTIVAAGLAGDARTFSWAVPTGVNTTTARIRVIAFDNASGQGQDDSNSNFSITDVGVSVTLTAPNGGEILRFNQAFNITWTVGAGSEDQVRGFDLFFTTNGTVFTNITPPNPGGPALAKEVRTFAWIVPAICTNSAMVVVRATSISNAVSSDSSNASFSINQPVPTIDVNAMDFTKGAAGNKQINIRLVDDSPIKFVDGVRLEISTDQAGTAFVMVPNVVVKQGGNKIQSKSRIGEDRIGVFFPDGARRIIRITNETCGIIVMRVRRVGQMIVLDTLPPAEAESIVN